MSYIPQEPVAVLTASDVDLLWRSSGWDELRRRHRIGDTHLYGLLIRLHKVRLSRMPFANDGIVERHLTAFDESKEWTVSRLSRASKRAERTIRNDIEKGELQATKIGRSWLISSEDAKSYIHSRKRVS